MEMTNYPSSHQSCPFLWIGFGCRQGTDRSVFENAVEQVFTTHGLIFETVVGIATLELRKDEQGLLTFCKKYQLPLLTFSATYLQGLPVPTPSMIVGTKVGTDSVAEACAYAAALSSSPLPPMIVIPKQVYRLDGCSGVVTIAVAQGGMVVG